MRYRTGKKVLVELVFLDKIGLFEVDYVHLFALRCGFFPEDDDFTPANVWEG